MRIALVEGASQSRVVDRFAAKEWKLFNKERNYEWKEVKRTIAAYEGRKVVGFASFKIVGGAAYLSQLIVSKNARRRQIGSKLLRRFEQYAKRRKCHVAYLETSEWHSEALRFYKSHDYRMIAKLGNNKFHLTWYFLSKTLT
jgi:ribosomal protein S18 acetylase RimI-like enzyme